MIYSFKNECKDKTQIVNVFTGKIVFHLGQLDGCNIVQILYFNKSVLYVV